MGRIKASVNRIANVERVLSIGHMLQLAGSKHLAVPPARLKEEVSRWGWKPSLWKLARLAATTANGSREQLSALTTDLIARFTESANEAERQIAHYVAAHKHVPMIHEGAIYFLEAMALLYGNESLDEPPDGTLAWWFLLANDYALEWREPDRAPLSLKERNLANLARAGLLNLRRDPTRHVVRMYLMLAQSPLRTPEWRD